MRLIILASASPRREILLRQIIGDTFTVEESDFDEEKMGVGDGRGGEFDLVTQVLRFSREKARAVASRHTEGIVIGADTVVICDGKVYGKPHTPERGEEMLGEIGGRVVEVMTGVTVIEIGDEGGEGDSKGEQRRELQTHEITRVFMKDLDDQTIRDYVATGEPLDKAGAFGIQGKGAALVERIEGDYFNVVGLPLYALTGMLKEVGVNVFFRS